MSIRTTVTLEQDVAERLHAESRRLGISFRECINETIRKGLLVGPTRTAKPFKIEPVDMGSIPGINYDNIGELIALGEGEDWR